MVEKRQARKYVISLRRDMSEENYITFSKLIFSKVVEHEYYINASQILIYVSFGKEVDTRALITESLRAGKEVLVPKVTGSTMIFVKINDFNELKPGTMGILEPDSNVETAPESTACMIMPGLVFDKEKHRIGYGGGFYDKYLESHPGIATIAVAFEYQVFDSIPSEDNDISPQIIITERRIIS